MHEQEGDVVMDPIVMDMTLFRDHSDAEKVRSQKILLWLLEGLTQANGVHMTTGKIPPLYESGVIYEPGEMPSTLGTWQDAPTMIRRGHGVCHSLAAWRSAELRRQGIKADPFLRWRSVIDARGEPSLRYHALVHWPDGRVEDPSKALGMRGPVLRRPVFVDPNFEDFRT